jgi:hypothetical protein
MLLHKPFVRVWCALRPFVKVIAVVAALFGALTALVNGIRILIEACRWFWRP